MGPGRRNVLLAGKLNRWAIVYFIIFKEIGKGKEGGGRPVFTFDFENILLCVVLIGLSEKITKFLGDRAKMFPPSFFFQKLPQNNKECTVQKHKPHIL